MTEENIKREEIVRKDKKKRNRHAFLEKHPVAYVLLHMAWAYFIIEIMAGVSLGLFFLNLGLPISLGPIIIGLIYLACHSLWYKPAYVGNFKGGNTPLGIKLASFCLIYWMFLIIQLLVWGKYAAPTVDSISNAFMAGIAEEVIFRLIPVSCFMRQWREEKKIPVVLAISAIIFGLIHIINISSGAPIPITILQVVGACFMGVILCAVYLRSGNILIPILMHVITDAICFIDSTQVGEGGIMLAQLSINNYIDIGVSAILAGIGIYLVRPAKRAEIISLWDNKFSRN